MKATHIPDYYFVEIERSARFPDVLHVSNWVKEVDYAPVKTCRQASEFEGFFKCSECGQILTFEPFYCPKCGARVVRE